MKRILTRILQTLLSVTLMLLITLLLLEWVYRYQLIDFYAPELRALNTEKKGGRKKILVLGDSFSAGLSGYVSLLRDTMPEVEVVNASVPGTGIRETNLIAPGRIAASKPDVIIYQLYVGNDLTDITKPVNMETLPLSRNVYWWLSDRLLFLRFANYRMAQFAPQFGTAGTSAELQKLPAFSPDTYTPRERLMIKANPMFIEQAVLLNNDQSQHQFAQLSAGLQELAQMAAERSIPLLLLVVPHCAQVSPLYYKRFEQMGAKMLPVASMQQAEYPFVQSIRKAMQAHADVQVLNPLLYLQQQPDVDSLYYASDIHMTQQGQYCLGRFIYPYLK